MRLIFTLQMSIPDELYESILEARRPETLNWEKCVASPYTNCLAIRERGEKVPKHNVQIMRVKNEKVLRQSLVSHLKPIIEEWAGQSMSSQVVVYGIRRYLKGAWLSLHVDQVPTHIFSVILQVGSIKHFLNVFNSSLFLFNFRLIKKWNGSGHC